MRNVRTEILVGTVAWRLAIALSGFVGWWLYGHDLAQVWFLTQAGNLLAAVVYLGLAIAYPLRVRAGVEAGQARARGSMTLLLVIIMVVYLTMMGGDLSDPADLFCHLITPMLAVLDWCFVGRSQNLVRWWHPLLWMVVPTLWLIGYSATGGYSWVQGSSLYSFLDPASGSYVGIVAGMVALSAACAYGLYGVGKLKAYLGSKPQTGLGPAAPYGQAGPYGQPAPYGQPGPFGQPAGGMAPMPQPGRHPGQQPWPAAPAGHLGAPGPQGPYPPPRQGPPPAGMPPAGRPPQGPPPAGGPPAGMPPYGGPPTQPPPPQGPGPQGPRPSQGPPPAGPPRQ